MQTQKANWVQWCTGILALFLVVSLFAGWFTPSYEAPVVPTTEAVVTGVLAGIVIPTIDTSTQDRLCELTDGCEYWEGSSRWLSSLDTDDAWDDFHDLLADLVSIDDDYLDWDYRYKDYQVRSYTDDDEADDNWEVKVFVKVTYWDTDDDEDDEKIYLLVTSVLDEGDYDEMTIQEVPRTFEF